MVWDDALDDLQTAPKSDTFTPFSIIQGSMSRIISNDVLNRVTDPEQALAWATKTSLQVRDHGHAAGGSHMTFLNPSGPRASSYQYKTFVILGEKLSPNSETVARALLSVATSRLKFGVSSVKYYT
ncbi:hypothetical protein QCA50_007381 [Cerrena zonata]|uniref:Uncharacterized protein n=1 Tax=Cerrena zonata TaxID=2478898 RepID=A0AAW0GIM0_9APHY